MISLVLDHRIQRLDADARPVSLLMMPVGTGSFLDHLREAVGLVGCNEWIVVPSFDPAPAYADHLRRHVHGSIRLLRSEELSDVLSDLEPSDTVAVIDPARWPMEPVEWASATAGCTSYRGATHVVAIGSGDEAATERVQCDRHGRVRRVQRLYRQVNWPAAAKDGVVMSAIPASALAGVRFRSARELRVALAQRGVLSRDIPLAMDLIDLTAEAGVLAINERAVERVFSNGHANGRAYERRNGALIGRRCQIHPSARLVGPVVVQEGVCIEEGASVIGPAVLGSGSRIQRGATVAQSVLLSDSVAVAGATVVHRLAFGSCCEQVRSGEESIVVPSTLPGLSGGPGRPGLGGAVEGEAGPRHRLHMAAKRVLDVALSTLALVVLFPVMALLALLIKLESRGPVFFVHRREQKGGADFACLKFRTMVADAHRLQRELYKFNELDGPQFKLRDDPRLTRLGRFLRETNLDELPQFINVLLGHMSLVGPRPSPFRENQICVPWRRARLSVPPGITGLWQLCRRDRSGGDFHQWIYYDLMYIRHLSIWLDLKILALTVATLGGRWDIPLSWLIDGDEAEAADRGHSVLPKG